jgi:hypothetical protein
MTTHTLIPLTTPTFSTGNFQGILALDFAVAAPLELKGFWYYSGAGCGLPLSLGVYDNTGTLVPNTVDNAPSFSGAAGSGWVKYTFPTPPTIPAELEYQLALYVNGVFAYQAGAWPIKNGTLYGIVDYSDASSFLIHSTTANGNQFYINPEVDTPSVFSASDDFNRTDGALGSNWTTFIPTDGDGATPVISSNSAIGGVAGTANGSHWIGSVASDDQFCQVTIPILPSPGDWVAPAVRMSREGDQYYNVICWNNGGGNYSFELFYRNGGWTQIGSTVGWTAHAGDVIKLEVIGDSIRVYLNGTAVMAVTDTNIAWGQPGIVYSSNTGALDDWTAGNVDTSVHVTLGGTAGHVSTYTIDSVINESGTSAPQDMRVLLPDAPSPSYAHAFLWLLPVEPGQGTSFGDSIATVQDLNAQNTYNLTCIQPGFPIDPWYADNPDDPRTQEETLMLDLISWANSNLATTGHEVHYLIGFSKSGCGGQQLFWRHQDVFEAVASWDFPADQSFTTFGSDSAAVYGDQTNFDSNYALSSGNLTAWKANGDTGTKNRVWIGGFFSFGGSVDGYDTLLTSLGIQHTLADVSASEHNWAPTPSWVGPAIEFLAAIGPAPGQYTKALAACTIV